MLQTCMKVNLILIRHWERRVEAHESLPTHPVGLFNPPGHEDNPWLRGPPPPPPRDEGGSLFCVSEVLLYVFHSDCLERAEGPRQAGANTRGPRRGEVGGGRRPPSSEYVKWRTTDENQKHKMWMKCDSDLSDVTVETIPTSARFQEFILSFFKLHRESPGLKMFSFPF